VISFQEFVVTPGAPASSATPLPPCPAIPSGASAGRIEFNDLSQPLLVEGQNGFASRRRGVGCPSPCRGFSVWPFRRRNGRGVRSPVRAPTLTASVRVEPKTFFANERTLLQWMNTAVLLATISITLLNFGTWESRVAGFILSPVAVFFLVYSFWVYLVRSKSLEKKEAINYNDRLGPGLLVVCLVGAISAIILLNIFYGNENALGQMHPGSNETLSSIPLGLTGIGNDTGTSTVSAPFYQSLDYNTTDAYRPLSASANFLRNRLIQYRAR